MRNTRSFQLHKVLIFTILISYSLGVRAQVLEKDSLALVALYQATGGDQWKDNTNWLKPGQNVSTWYGIRLVNNRVWEILLDDNNLAGILPEEIGDLTSLDLLALGHNHLSGSIPASLKNLRHMFALDLSANDYIGDIPSFLFQMPLPPGVGGNPRIMLFSENKFTGITPWDGDYQHMADLSVENNHLDFGSIETLLKDAITFLEYAPQEAIYTADEITLREGAALTLHTAAGGSVNRYQWVKEGNDILTAKQSDYTFIVTNADEGIYTARVTNDIATALTLERNPITLHVTNATVYVSCDGSDITLQPSVSDPKATYRWSNGQTSSAIVVTGSGKYGVQIETNDYVIKDTLEVIILPRFFLGADIDTCEPSALLSSHVSNASSYEWQIPGGGISTEATLNATVSGRYILEIEKDGCVVKDTIEVALNHFTTGDFTITSGTASVEDKGVVLTEVELFFTNTTGVGENYSWSFGEGGTSLDEKPAHTYTKAGEYMITLSGTDSRGCPITVEKSIRAEHIVITNAISPNGDGKNDKLYVEPFLYSATFKVINRWGQSVYETSSYHDDFTGGNLESGVYFYELYFKEIDKHYKGYVNIMK